VVVRLEEDFTKAALTEGIVLRVEAIEPMERLLVRLLAIDIQRETERDREREREREIAYVNVESVNREIVG
jgi:hypothetical protein